MRCAVDRAVSVDVATALYLYHPVMFCVIDSVGTCVLDADTSEYEVYTFESGQ